MFHLSLSIEVFYKYLSEQNYWASLQFEAIVVRSPLISPNRKQDFLLSSLSPDLYHHCPPHPKPRRPLGGLLSHKKSHISKVLANLIYSSFTLALTVTLVHS